jgi:hypothetical protein
MPGSISIQILHQPLSNAFQVKPYQLKILTDQALLGTQFLKGVIANESV